MGASRTRVLVTITLPYLRPALLGNLERLGGVPEKLVFDNDAPDELPHLPREFDGTSKVALNQLTRHLAAEIAGSGVTAEMPRANSEPIAIPIESSPGYFDVMGIPLRGRDFRDDENKKESRVAIVNETFAKKFFNGQDPIGRRFNWHGPTDPFFEIVGVVPDGKYNSLGEDPRPAVYTPLYRDYSGTVTLVARTRGDPRQVLSALRGEVQKLDPSISVYAAKTLKEHMGTSLFPARMAAIALGSFGILALILAAVGIYGVMSHVVAGRTREIASATFSGPRPPASLPLRSRRPCHYYRPARDRAARATGHPGRRAGTPRR